MYILYMLSYGLFYGAIICIFGISFIKAFMYNAGNLKYFFFMYIFVVIIEISLEYLQYNEQ